MAELFYLGIGTLKQCRAALNAGIGDPVSFPTPCWPLDKNEQVAFVVRWGW